MKIVTMLTKSMALAGLIAFAMPVVHAEVEIPVVPASTMTNGVPKHIDAKPKETATANYSGLAKVNEDSVLIMEVGVNQIVPVAIEHTNRIVTPFSKPALESAADDKLVKISIKDNVAYVATASEKPVTVFITENGDQSRALSLTLVPQRIPPREIFLRLPEGLGMLSAASNAKAEKWEQSQPYIETIRTVFRKIALGEVPQGYSMSKIPAGMRMPSCQLPGLTFDFSIGQVLMGHSISVMVGVARNTSGQPVEFKEGVCGAWDVAAVAAWPLNVLEPGQRTEVYVARKVGQRSGPVSKRPSLVGAY
ncbi:hypothetical protein [Eoetvoesiella caeni]